MAVLFISDLHLQAERPQLQAILLRFLAGQARSAQALFILGDLFEAWIGDDGADTAAAEIAAALHGLAAHGVAIGFQHGNRDFLLGHDYAERCGMRLLPDPCVIDLHGRPALLSHGDALCTGDADYQRFRRTVRDPAWQQEFLAQPLQARREFARRARTASAEHQRGMRADIADVEPDAVETLMAGYGVDLLIHGHTHRPADHPVQLAGHCGERIVLADWRAAGEALEVTPEGRRRLLLE